MSWIEVESKIKVHDAKEARKRIEKIASFVKKEYKIDDYYSLSRDSYPKKSLRVRGKGKKRQVNFKQWRNYTDGIWAKKEVEFEVSDLKNFFDLLDDFGFRKWMKKEKKTEYEGFNYGPIKVERIGRTIQMSSDWDPEEFKKHKTRIKNRRPHLKNEINHKIRRLIYHKRLREGLCRRCGDVTDSKGDTECVECRSKRKK